MNRNSNAGIPADVSGKRIALFDLDGTLTDPGIGITNSVIYALDKYGIHVSDRSELYPFIGPPLADSFRKYYGFSEEEALQAIDYYREYFRAGGILKMLYMTGYRRCWKNLRTETLPLLFRHQNHMNSQCRSLSTLICTGILTISELPQWTGE